VLEATNRRRVPELVAIRKARMRASPFAFLRGAPAVRTYREQLARFAATRALEVWYSRVDGATIEAPSRGRRRRAVTERLADAQHHTNLGALPRLTEPAGGSRRFVEDPPLLTHVEECGEAWVAEVLARYRASLPEERRRLLARFRPHDAARKVIGVGSVGTRCYVVLLLGDRADDPLLLQVKQATASVLEPYAGRSRHRHHGRRVVAGQRLLQTASDIFLGWTGDGAAHYYVRQLWDMKASMQLEAMSGGDLVDYGRLCGWSWPGPTPAAATPPPSAATWGPGTASTAPRPTSPRPTPTRPRPTTRRLCRRRRRVGRPRTG